MSSYEEALAQYTNFLQQNNLSSPNWLQTSMRTAGRGMLLNPSSASNLGNYMNQQSTGNAQAQSTAAAYGQAQQSFAPTSELGAVLGSTALQNIMGNNKGIQALGEQYRRQMQRVNQNRQMPSSAKQDQSNAMAERLAMGIPQAQNEAFNAGVQQYGQLANAASNLANSVPVYNYDAGTQLDPATAAYIQRMIKQNSQNNNYYGY